MEGELINLFINPLKLVLNLKQTEIQIKLLFRFKIKFYREKYFYRSNYGIILITRLTALYNGNMCVCEQVSSLPIIKKYHKVIVPRGGTKSEKKFRNFCIQTSIRPH